ncbi:MAG: hypothetical protein RL349_1116 [Bacteroidota bacterium]
MIHHSTLPVMEHFYTLQGEGSHSGRAAYFIRLAGCDVGCVWCDVKESWNISPDQYMSIDSILEAVGQTATDFVVITGGEPTMHDLSPLTSALKNAGYEIAIETAGVNPLLGQIDWYCFSPKKFKAPNDGILAMTNELKVVVNHPSDIPWAQEWTEKLPESAELYLQPEWSKQEQMNPIIVDFVKANPSWRISVQTHKFLQIP